MKFLAQHNVDDTHPQESLFDTTDNTFNRDFRIFCNRTGRTVKDVLTFKIAQEATKTQKNFNEITVSVEICLRVYFGDIYDQNNFFGHCEVKIICKLEPTDPGLYEKKFSELDRIVANLIIAKYQNSTLFDI